MTELSMTPDPILQLSDNYVKDLEILRNMDVLVMNSAKFDRLNILCAKYGMRTKVNEHNYVDMLGKLNFEINERLESFVRTDLLERIREKSNTSIPRNATKSESASPDAWDR